jgi:predicted nucleic acid-binding protein
MIFVDTSVWVAALRNGHSPEAVHLSALLDRDEVALAAPVRVEILAGASRRDLPRLRRTLSALPVFFPDASAWDRIDVWIDRAVAAGQRFGFADLLIASVAAVRQRLLWSLDADFERMARLGFVETYRSR